jgi:predicted DNA-binding transcriptional regulator YafY
MATIDLNHLRIFVGVAGNLSFSAAAAKLEVPTSTVSRAITSLEADFVRIAKKFGENRGIGYGAWRDAGVPAVVLKKAGVAAIYGPGTNIPKAAADLLDKLNAELGYSPKAAAE